MGKFATNSKQLDVFTLYLWNNLHASLHDELSKHVWFSTKVPIGYDKKTDNLYIKKNCLIATAKICTSSTVRTAISLRISGKLERKSCRGLVLLWWDLIQ